MRLEFKMELDQVSTPRFSVESVEGIGKVFTLATLVLNVLETRKSVEIVFHGMSRDDPARKIEGLREIMESSPTARPVVYEGGDCKAVAGSSSYYQWLTISRSDD